MIIPLETIVFVIVVISSFLSMDVLRPYFFLPNHRPHHVVAVVIASDGLLRILARDWLLGILIRDWLTGSGSGRQQPRKLFILKAFAKKSVGVRW